VRARRPSIAAAVLAVAGLGIVPSCTVTSNPTAGVRANARGEAVILAPRCTDERIEAVQVADLGGPVRWRAEGGGNAYPTIFTVGREPPLMRETDPLDGPLDPQRAYVATVEYAGALPDVDVEFHPSTLSTARVVTPDGDAVTPAAFAEEADLECIGGWLWVFGGVAIAIVLGVIAAFVLGLVVVVKVVRKARRQRASVADAPGRPDLSGR
jgi:hypothetical protein